VTKTSIEWTDHSVNPLRARHGANSGHYCEKVSPGCKHCYSSNFQPRFGMPTFQEQRRLDVEHWLDRSKLVEVLKRRKPTKWFWCDMTDMFGDWVPIEHIALCFATMAATPWHVHQVLTKRSARMREVVQQLYANDGELLLDAADELASLISACHVGEDEWRFPLANVWIGTSVEDQARADDRIPDLLETPAAVRFISAEPLLEEVTIWAFLKSELRDKSLAILGGAPLPGIDWCIAGAESGNRARPMQEEWVRALRDQCSAAGVSFFYKQKLEGKKKVGLPLPDGRQWAEFPETRNTTASLRVDTEHV
jgi:protein gp37